MRINFVHFVLLVHALSCVQPVSSQSVALYVLLPVELKGADAGHFKAYRQQVHQQVDTALNRALSRANKRLSQAGTKKLTAPSSYSHIDNLHVTALTLKQVPQHNIGCVRDIIYDMAWQLAQLNPLGYIELGAPTKLSIFLKANIIYASVYEHIVHAAVLRLKNECGIIAQEFGLYGPKLEPHVSLVRLSPFAANVSKSNRTLPHPDARAELYSKEFVRIIRGFKAADALPAAIPFVPTKLEIHQTGSLCVETIKLSTLQGRPQSKAARAATRQAGLPKKPTRPAQGQLA